MRREETPTSRRIVNFPSASVVVIFIILELAIVLTLALNGCPWASITIPETLSSAFAAGVNINNERKIKKARATRERLRLHISQTASSPIDNPYWVKSLSGSWRHFEGRRGWSRRE